MSKINTVKKTFLIFLLLEIFFSYSSAFAVTTADGYNYSNAGISTQIKQYLCAPKDVPVNQTNYTNGALNSQSNFQQQAAYGNANSSDLYDCINRMYRVAIILAGVVGVFFIVIAGYTYMSAEGNDESVTKAKDILVSTISSMVILMAGFILLKALNPDLIQFRSVQPPSIKISDLKLMPAPNNVIVSLNSDGSAPTSIQGGVGTNASAQLLAAGCTFQTSKQSNESQNMTQGLFNKMLSICNDIKSAGQKGEISSVIGQGQHSAGSYHYKGCAIDFADGIGNGFFDFNTKQGRPMGIAIYNAAVKNGISLDRINPGTDRTQTYHIHIDLGSSCTSN